VDLAIVIDPSDDHVSSGAAVVLRETESDIAEGLHLDLECDVPLAGCPEHQEIIVEDSAVFPLDGHGAADEKKEERTDRGLHLSCALLLKASETEARLYLYRVLET